MNLNADGAMREATITALGSFIRWKRWRLPYGKPWRNSSKAFPNVLGISDGAGGGMGTNQGGYCQEVEQAIQTLLKAKQDLDEALKALGR